MANQKRILISLPDSLLSEIDNYAEIDSITRSELIREAMRFYIKERRRRNISEMMEKGYEDMGAINLKIAEEFLEIDELQLKNYEQMLSECEE
ncbi:MAG: ribbon-helix-helix protein, CopG family [Clostridia bacterium]|nr:ribbon-helix-helix protein, CopG family [Clostridia bacterium]